MTRNPFARRVQDRGQPLHRHQQQPGGHHGQRYRLVLTSATRGKCPSGNCLFLDGNQAPVIESSQMEFSHLGMVHRGYHAFGAGAVEPRGVVYNTGV